MDKWEPYPIFTIISFKSFTGLNNVMKQIYTTKIQQHLSIFNRTLQRQLPQEHCISTHHPVESQVINCASFCTVIQDLLSSYCNKVSHTKFSHKQQKKFWNISHIIFCFKQFPEQLIKYFSTSRAVQGQVDQKYTLDF